jgi:hypothetical protein
MAPDIVRTGLLKARYRNSMGRVETTLAGQALLRKG